MHGSCVPRPVRGRNCRRLAALALGLALAACSSTTRPAVAGAKSPAPKPSPVAALLPPAMRPVGRVLAVDGQARTAIVEFSRYAELPGSLDGATLFARDRDLRPIARLEGTPYLRGLILGVKTVDGQPVAGDEVVLPSPTMQPVGRVVAMDAKAKTAVVEFSRSARLPAGLDGVALYACDRDLRPLARLEGTSAPRGFVLDVKITAGHAAVGDEVVLFAEGNGSSPTPDPVK
jgi:hypothetical protein